MTTNDAQMDVLLRRHARKAGAANIGQPAAGATNHPDPDELSAFAEGAVPGAARAQYISHLADCDQCRALVSQLTMAAGVTIAPEAGGVAARGSFWERLSGLFAINRLGYAAAALVLVVAAGITFVVLNRGTRDTNLAQGSQTRSEDASAAKTPESNNSPNEVVTNPPPKPAPTVEGKLEVRKEEPATVAKKDVLDGLDADKSAPGPPASKAASGVSESAPVFAPPPPGERREAEREDREARSLSTLAPAPKKAGNANDDLKATEQPDRGRNMNDTNNVQQEQVLNQNDKPKGPNRSRSQQEPLFGALRDNRAQSRSNERAPETQKQNEAGASAGDEERRSERSAGGHRFHREGNAWVDSLYKSSMSRKSVKRNSDDFQKLDAGLQSIANQLGGEVVVVWKGKAYRIH